jgi:hypothetical protein
MMANEKLPDLSSLTGFNILTIRHDDWCLLLLGQGDCNCDAEIGGITEVTDENIDSVAATIARDNRRTAKLRRASRNKIFL